MDDTPLHQLHLHAAALSNTISHEDILRLKQEQERIAAEIEQAKRIEFEMTQATKMENGMQFIGLLRSYEFSILLGVV